jgi:hypothetical protein
MASRYPVVRQLGKLANIVAGDALLLRGALNEAPTATIASAGSIDIGAAISNTINITGAVTITALGTAAAGIQRTLIFGGASTLTHNATSLVLPTAANIVPAADDTAEFLSLGSGNWRCTRYQRKSGYALLDATGGGGSATQAVAISAGVLDLSASTSTTITVDLNQNVTSITQPAGSVGNVVERSIVFTQSGAANFTVTGWTGVTIEGGVAPVAGVGAGVVTEYMVTNTNNGGWRMYVDQGVTNLATGAVAGLMSAADKTKLDGLSAGFGAPTIAVMLATQQSIVTTMANVTALVAALVANATYRITAFVTFQSAATTTGLNLGWTAPGGLPAVMLEVVVPITSTAAASQLRKIYPNAAETSGTVLGTGATAINSNHTATIQGLLRTGGTAGNFQVQFASETTTAVTLQIGSTLLVERIA